MTNARLDQEERELLDAYEASGFVSDITEERKEQLSSAARAAFKKDRRMNIRMPSRDLQALQRRALEEGLPHQSLVCSVLHKYVSGGLENVVANKLTRRPRDARG